MQKLLKKEVIFTFPTQEVDTSKFGPKDEFNGTCQPYGISKPLGLLVWGATNDTSILWIGCGNEGQAHAQSGSIPARFFETGRSFEEILALADAGELELSLPQRQILHMSALDMGNQLTIRTRGPFSRLVMWGVQLRGLPSPAYAEVKRVVNPEIPHANGFYRGRVVLPTFDGEDYEACVIEAPSSAEVATMLAPQLADLRVRGARW